MDPSQQPVAVLQVLQVPVDTYEDVLKNILGVRIMTNPLPYKGPKVCMDLLPDRGS